MNDFARQVHYAAAEAIHYDAPDREVKPQNITVKVGADVYRQPKVHCAQTGQT